MKVAVAQIQSFKGDIPKSIEKHKELIHLAIVKEADFILFPELSLTGYEPNLAKDLATTPEDNRLDIFQTISNTQKISIGVGLPTKNHKGICISLLLFTPQKTRQLYSKKYLHPDEEPYFVSGRNLPIFEINNTKIALAICYELSISEHSKNAYENQADIYLASVAKSAKGMKKASQTLTNIAKKYGMTVLISNSLGPSDDFVSAGHSAVWNKQGLLVRQLDDTKEGLLVFDTITGEILL